MRRKLHRLDHGDRPGQRSANAGFTWTINPAAPFVLNPLSPAAPALAGGAVTYTASSSNGVNARYSWFFDDGTAQTAYSSSPSITHTFTTPGIYYVTVTAIDDLQRAADADGGADHLPRRHS